MNNQIPKFREFVMGTSFSSIQNMCIYSMLYTLYFIQKLIKFSISVLFSSWYKSLSFSKSLLCLAFIAGTFPVQPSLLYTTFIFGNLCAAFIVAPNLFSAILQASLCRFFFSHFSSFFILVPDFSTILQPSFLVSSPRVSGDSSLQPPLLC